MSIDDFDNQRIFGTEGASILHLSGLIAALSPQTGKLCLQLAKAAKAHGTTVSFDLNYRTSFWAGREAELAQIFEAFAHQSDMLIGNEEDFQLALGIKGPEAGGEGIASKMDSFKNMIRNVRSEFGQVKLFATTLREVLSANEHL